MSVSPGEPPRPLSAPSGGDGAPLDAPPPHLRKVNALVAGETGLLFEPLVLFAEPLFDLYGLDPADAFALRHAPEDADEGMAAVLEAARLLWAYYALPPERQAERHPRLAAFLLGPDYTPADEADLEEVLERMGAQWELLTPEDRATAQTPDAPPLGFDALLAHPAFALPAEGAAPEPYGPEGLGELEAQALFAQPLLDAAHDPDEMETALERASAYWDLVHLAGEERSALRGRILRAYALTPAERPRLEAEVDAMIRRFEELFPERRR